MMRMYVHFNPNPAGHSVGDCVTALFYLRI
nr:MAG TPA: hypothetical protein [Caudoviricetes sp.]